MTKLELFTHQYNRLKRLYGNYERIVLSGKYNQEISKRNFDNCTRINQLLFDLHVNYNNGSNDSIQG